jgi:hypothetical protein
VVFARKSLKMGLFFAPIEKRGKIRRTGPKFPPETDMEEKVASI